MCVFKDSNTGYDFKGKSYFLDVANSENHDDDNPGPVKVNTYMYNDTGGQNAYATTLSARADAVLGERYIDDRRGDLRVMVHTSLGFDMKSHTGGFVNQRPFFTDAKLCSAPWGKRLNVKIIDMSHVDEHARDSAYEPATSHFHTLKQCNEDGHSQVITSVIKPITVELKVLLIDPDDQNSCY